MRDMIERNNVIACSCENLWNKLSEEDMQIYLREHIAFHEVVNYNIVFLENTSAEKFSGWDLT